LAKDWRRPSGRPLHTWLRTLEADLKPLNFGLNSACKYTQDGEQWKHLVPLVETAIRSSLRHARDDDDDDNEIKYLLTYCSNAYKRQAKKTAGCTKSVI